MALSLVYLILISFKNTVLEILRKPGKLALYLFVIAAIVGLFILSLFTSQPGEPDRVPLFWLQIIVFAYITLFVVLGIQKGLTSGDVIFDMSDVNLVFTSPINPRATLLYGLGKMAKMSLLAGFFILFQSNTFASVFGVDFGGLMIVFFLCIVSMIAQSLISLLIYSVTNGKPGRKRVVRIIAVAAFTPLIIFLGLHYFSSGSLFAALEAATQSPCLSAVPITGWATASSFAFITGETAAGIGWLLALLAGCAIMLLYILFSRIDYYEDVLVATETAFEKKRALAEGDMQAATASSRKIKVSKTGLKGLGASTFFYKHLRETFRQNRFGFFSLSTLIVVLSWVLASFIFRDELDLTVILQIAMWLQVFLIGIAFGMKELYLHYIYLVPAPPFVKLIWNNLEAVFKTFLEAVLMFGLSGIILGAHPMLIASVVVTYSLFSLLLLGINYLSLRWTQTEISKGLVLIVYLLAVIICLLPSLALAFAVGFMIGGEAGLLLGLGVLSVGELLTALACFALAKNVLHTADMPSIKTN